MENPRYANSFKDLIVYKKSLGVANKIFKLTTRFPRDEIYSLTDQMRRAVRSIGAQISEAWAKRKYEKSFINKLVDADGEQMETQHWLEIAFSCGYLSSEEKELLLADLLEIGRMLNPMMQKSELFCGSRPHLLHDTLSEYMIETED